MCASGRFEDEAIIRGLTEYLLFLLTPDDEETNANQRFCNDDKEWCSANRLIGERLRDRSDFLIYRHCPLLFKSFAISKAYFVPKSVPALCDIWGKNLENQRLEGFSRSETALISSRVIRQLAFEQHEYDRSSRFLEEAFSNRTRRQSR